MSPHLQLFLCQESGDPHGPLELVADDGEVAAVLHLGVHDLRDDLLALAAAAGAAEAHRARCGVEGKVAAIRIVNNLIRFFITNHH